MHQNFFIVMWTSQHIWMDGVSWADTDNHTHTYTYRQLCEQCKGKIQWKVEKKSESICAHIKHTGQKKQLRDREQRIPGSRAHLWWALLTFKIFTFNLVCNMLIHVLAYTRQTYCASEPNSESQATKCRLPLLFAYLNFLLLSFVRHVILQLPKIKK